MKNKIIIITGLIALAIGLIASDHINSPAVTNETDDIADFYAFEGENKDNITFIATLQGLLSPARTADAKFDQNVLVEFNIDTNNDRVEDLVIQAIRRGDKMHFFGPVAPTKTGVSSEIIIEADINESVKITPYQQEPIVRTTTNGIKYFAGATDDPFFFDIGRFKEIIAGKATGFNNPGNDTWNGLNVLSIAVEVPKSLLGDADVINTWVTSNRKK